MAPRFSRRQLIAAICGGAIAVVAPTALGWRPPRTDTAASPAAANGGGDESNPQLATPTSVVIPLAVVPPPEEAVFIGIVDRVQTPSRLIGSNARFAGVTVDLSAASPIYPGGHLVREGDDFISRGRWLGAVGQSIWHVQFVDFNVRRVRGLIAAATANDPEARSALVDISTGRTWQIVFRAAETDHFTRGGATIQPSPAAFEFADGAGVEIIGYEDRPGVIVATFIEAQS